MTAPTRLSTHACPGGCGSQVPRHLYTCKPCWARLPKPYRDAINVAYRRGTAREHIAAMRRAREWYEEHAAEPLPPLAADGTTTNPTS